MDKLKKPDYALFSCVRSLIFLFFLMKLLYVYYFSMNSRERLSVTNFF